MIENVLPIGECRSLARRRKKSKSFRTVKRHELNDALSDGWEGYRENKQSVRLVQPKPKPQLLEDRVWALLYRMSFTHLSGDGGARLLVTEGQPGGPANQIDVVGLDGEVALAIECKSAQSPRRASQFPDYIAKLAVIRKRFADAIHAQFTLDHRRVPLLIIFTWDLVLSENDAARAAEQNVVLLNEHDLSYYEELVGHLGPAAKYQFFSDLMPGRRVKGLEISLPALSSRIGRHTCFTFSISPEYLLKIAYVSHRAKGKATDVDAYQRMVKKSRLKRIREYIDQNGVFPTNIVINIDGKRHVRFEPGKQQGGPEGAKYGVLHLTPSYKSAWIIDGQHRLFAYSGHPRARTSHLSVLAFEGLPPSTQAQLFIDINHEQKSVKRNLLHELYAELHWDAEDEEKRVGSIVSKAIQGLNQDTDSPLCGRILLADDRRMGTRCISLESVFKALTQPGFFVVKKGVDYGPFWTGDNERTLRRAMLVMKGWLTWITGGAQEWWDLGMEEGGGLAMNDGITVCIGVLRSVLRHLAHDKRLHLIHMGNSELLDVLKPFGEALGSYFGELAPREQEAFRARARGVQGQTTCRRQCEAAVHDRFPDFNPPGLAEALKLANARTNERAYPIVREIEDMLQMMVVDTLKEEFQEEDAWWYNGVPVSIRTKAATRREEEQGSDGPEKYLDLIDFRDMALKNWQLFEGMLAYGERGNKQKRTEWLVKVNDLRKIVMHPSRGRVVDLEQFALLQEYHKWLKEKFEGIE